MRKLNLYLGILVILTTLAVAPPTIQLSDSGSSAIDIELDNGYNIVSVPLNGQISTDQLDSCNLEDIQGGKAVTWGNSGALESSDVIKGTRAYIVKVGSSGGCSTSIEESAVEELNEGSLNSGWTMFSPPGEGWSFSDLDSITNCNLQNPYSLSLGEGAESISMDDSLSSQSNIYWIQTNSECSYSLDSSDGLSISPPSTDGDTSSGSDEDSSSTDSGSDINPGDLYFWDTEANTALVNNEAGSSDDAVYTYDMYDNDLVGGFTSHASSRAERTIVVENEYYGETVSRTASGLYVGIPENSHVWGTGESGIYQLSSYGTDFNVKVKDPNTDEVLQEETFTFNPSSQAVSVTTDPLARNTDHVTISGSNLEIDGSNGNNAYVTWDADSSEDKTVEIDFVVNDAGHARFEVCQDGCSDTNEEIAAAYYLYGDSNVRIDQPYDNSYDSDPGRGEHQYQTGEEYTFKIIQDGYDVDMSIEGPGVDHSRDLDIYSFDHFSIDTEAGTSDRWPGIDLTVKDVTIEE